MNWLAKGKYGLIALSALFLSCENDDLLSLDFDPQDENINLSFTELTIPFQLVQRDSINTSNIDRILVGDYKTTEFGNVEASGYVNMGISANAANNADSDDQLDSLVLFVVKNYFYGDASASQQTVNIHQLSEPFKDSTAYYSDNSLPYDATPIGTFHITVDAEEATDTLSTRLSDAVGNDLLEKLKADAAVLDSSALFQDYFRGLALVPASENAFVSGFHHGIQMKLYYSAPGDTVSKSFSMITASNPIRISNFNSIKVDRSASALANIDQPREVASAADNRFYLQSSTGLIPRLNFQPLVEFVKTNSERVLLNRVVLHIGLNETKESMPPPAALLGYQLEDDGITRLVKYSDVERARIYAGVYNDLEYLYNDVDNKPRVVNPSAIKYDSTNVAYNVKLTSFTQNLVDGFIDNPEVLLQPNDLNSGLTQLVTEADSIKLRVYYTTLK